jgi:SAM-dependent methyltransferase
MGPTLKEHETKLEESSSDPAVPLAPPPSLGSGRSAQAERVGFRERLLLALSRKPGALEGAKSSHEDDAAKNPLALLCRVFPGFLSEVRGKDIVDFGSGKGYQSAALAESGARCVLGVEINPKHLADARAHVDRLGLVQKVSFVEKLDERVKRKFDLAISQNAMEHYGDPAGILREMASALKANGKVLVTFGPPWFAPHGSHMTYFARVPWVNLLFDERTVMRVRARFRNDGAIRYEDVESGLSKMSIRKFMRIVVESGLQVEFLKFDCVKGLDWLGKIPLVKELFINHVSCALSKRVKG